MGISMNSQRANEWTPKHEHVRTDVFMSFRLLIFCLVWGVITLLYGSKTGYATCLNTRTFLSFQSLLCANSTRSLSLSVASIFLIMCMNNGQITAFICCLQFSVIFIFRLSLEPKKLLHTFIRTQIGFIMNLRLSWQTDKWRHSECSIVAWVCMHRGRCCCCFFSPSTL